MKTLRILTLAAAVLTLAACGNEEFIENNPGNEAAKPEFMTFTASAPQTRTLLDGLNVHWVEYDEIAIWDGSEGYQKFMVDTESINGSEATFTGPALVPGADYTAFYPLIAVESMNATSVNFNLPAEQTAVAGTFANQLAPSLAKATGGSTNLVFDNLCALVKFTVPADMAGKGTFTLVGGNANSVLAGEYWVEYSTGNQSPGIERTNRVTLKGDFEAEKDYYFVVLPGALLNGFSLLYEDSEGRLYRKATSNSALLQPGRILNLGTLTGFEPYISQAIVPEGMGTPNGDGSVTLSDDEKEQLKAIERLDLSAEGLKNLYGIEVYSNLKYLYCTDNPGLTKIDVRKLTKLEILDCKRSALTELKVNGLSNLWRILCAENKLTELDVSGLTSLSQFNCERNRLTSLNLDGLTSLSLLNCYENKLTELDISMLPALNKLRCGKQELPSGVLALSLYMTEEQYTTMWPDNQGWGENDAVRPYRK